MPSPFWLSSRLCLVAALLSGCAGTYRVDQLVPPLPANEVADVWRADSSQTLHRIQIQGDSLTGYLQISGVACDSCRVAILLNEVDSLSFTTADITAVKAVGAIGLTFGVMILFLRWISAWGS